MKPFFSIIIPFKDVDKYLLENLQWCSKQEYKKFEILLLPDNKLNKSLLNKIDGDIKIIPTGKIYPSEKRNIGIRKSKGNVCAFIDSDAFPNPNWLKHSVKYFKYKKIAAVGGPNIPPNNDPFLNQITGEVISNVFCTGTTSKRFKVPNKNFLTYELSCSNLLVRKSILKKAGYFDEGYLTGEDSKLCFQIQKLGQKILYARDVQVYHHQRPWLLPYLKQIWVWGLNKGNLISRIESNAKLQYFIPSFFVIFIILGIILSFYLKTFFFVFISIIIFYLIISLIFSLKSGAINFPFIFIGIVLTHITYGISFLLGVLNFKNN